MEEVMNKAMDKKLKERREYLDLIEETKEINYDLYLKMVQADQKRSVAFSQKPLADDVTKAIIKPELLKVCDQPLRRAKSTKTRRVTKKSKAVKEDVVDATDETVEQDEEEVALAWAYTVLIKEFYRRNEVRGKVTTTKKKVNDKLEALWRFRKLKEKKKKEERKKNKDRKVTDMVKQAAIAKTLSNSQQNANKKDGKNEEEAKETGGIKKKGSFKRKVQVCNLQDQIESKRKLADDGINPVIQQSFIAYKIKSEQEKIDEAKNVLRYLKERQQLRDKIDSLGQKRTDKTKGMESGDLANEEGNAEEGNCYIYKGKYLVFQQNL